MASQLCPECESDTPGPRSETCTNEFHQPDVVRHEFDPDANGDGCCAYVGSELCLQPREAECHVVEPPIGARVDGHKISCNAVAVTEPGERGVWYVKEWADELCTCDVRLRGQPSNAAAPQDVERARRVDSSAISHSATSPFPDPIPTTPASSKDVTLKAAQESAPNSLKTDREAWLISDVAFIGRTKIDTPQYVELRDLAVRLLNRVRDDIANAEVERLRDRIAELERRLRIPFGKFPCAQCGGPHDFDTTLPSVVWNKVIRAKGLPEYLCTTCIVREFVRVGIGFTAQLWNEEFNGVPIEVTVNGQNANDAALISDENTSLRAEIASLKAAGIDRAIDIVKAKRDDWQTQQSLISKEKNPETFDNLDRLIWASNEIITALTAEESDRAITVEGALAELLKMFPKEVTIGVGVWQEKGQPQWEITLDDFTHNGTTLAEAMSKVREFAAEKEGK